MIRGVAFAVLRLIAQIVPWRDRDAWLREWTAELAHFSAAGRLDHRNARAQEIEMLRRVLGSFHDAAWLRRQFTRDADLVHDLRYGARLLRRTPGFTLLAVSVLALGVGATTGIFSVVDALLIRQLPYRAPERIVLLFEAAAGRREALESVAPANFIDWKEQARTVDVLAAAEPSGFTHTDGPEPQSLPAMRVSDGFFDAFGVPALYGRTFTSEEYTPGRNRVVVLGYGTWTQYFGADPAIVGRAIRLNSQPYMVVGVLPPTFRPRLLVTFGERGVFTPKIWTETDRGLRGARYYASVARLKPGITIQQAQSEFEAIAARLAQQHPRTNGGQTIQLLSLRDHLAGDLRSSISILSGAVILLLVIAMANTANLLMARAAARTREIAVRSAIGADGGRLIRQFLAETLLLATLGCLLGLVVAYATTRLIVVMAPGDIPALHTLGVNGRVLAFSCGLTFLVTILVGLAPAWRGSAVRAAGTTSVLGTASGESLLQAKRRRGRFVVAELAIALTLLMAGGLLLRSFSGLLRTSPGFQPEGVALVQIFARLPKSTPSQLAVYLQQILDAMRPLPAVQAAGAASVIPFLDTTGGSSVPVVIEGRPAPAAGDEPSAFVNIATPGYFSALRIPVLEGRTFADADSFGRTPVTVISQAFARRYWQAQSPLGQFVRFSVRGTSIRAEVIGVVADVRYDALDRPASQELYLAHAQVPTIDMTLVVRTSGNPALLLDPLRSRLRAVAPNQPVYRATTLPDLVGQSLIDRRFTLSLVLAFAVLAVALAATGVYGVVTILSAQRTKEYGLRLALGARRSEILTMVLRDGARITAVGLALGLVGALIAGRLLRGVLFGIGPTDLWTLTGVCATLAVVAGIACLAPAVRATRVSPIAALRSE
jgi:putative ABC transport system permease protein